mgnify:FL=1
MAEMYMKNIRDWRDATLMLSFEEKGYYDELLNLIYIYDDLLPDNDELICRAMPVHKKMHLRLKQKLLKARLISIEDGFYYNKRASEEIIKINGISEKNKLKAQKRWAKSSKNIGNGDAGALKEDAKNNDVSKAEAVLNLNSESDSECDVLINKAKQKSNLNPSRKNKNGKSKRRYSNRRDKKQGAKCAIDTVINPDGKIPEEYRSYAEEQGLSNPERVFQDWANWWVSEDGRKAGAYGWFTTWKARVRKDVDRQMAKVSDHKKHTGSSGCSTTNGARLALDRRRAAARTK